MGVTLLIIAFARGAIVTSRSITMPLPRRHDIMPLLILRCFIFRRFHYAARLFMPHDAAMIAVV